MVDVAIKEFVGLNSKFYLIHLSNSSEYKKVENVNKHVITIISHKLYKDALLN